MVRLKEFGFSGSSYRSAVVMVLNGMSVDQFCSYSCIAY